MPIRRSSLVRPVAALGAVLALSVPAPARGVSADGHWWPWPLAPVPEVVAHFDAPDHDYGPGHRGIDLRSTPGQPVIAVTAGVVTVAGPVAGRGVVVVRAGRVRVTYEPVVAEAQVGDDVPVGALLGRVEQRGSHCWPTACLHVGVRQHDEYVDPLPRFAPRPVRLKPLQPTTQHGSGQPGPARTPAQTSTAPGADEDVDSKRPLIAGAVLGGTAAVVATGALRRRGQARG